MTRPGQPPAPPRTPGVLTPQDGLPFEVSNPDGGSPVVLICEHASNRMPAKLNTLGLSEDQLSSHVAWDPGALDLARALSAALDAPLVAARFSRLVYDCNRPPEAESAMPADTEVCPIPGNAALSEGERDARAEEIYAPFHAAVAGAVAAKKDPVAVSIHSFTPVFHGVRRAVEVGYLFSRNDHLARAMQAQGQGTGRAFDIRLNEPYGPEDGVLHTIDLHTGGGEAPHVMIEVRNDLLADAAGQRAVQVLILHALRPALAQIQHANEQATPGAQT
ncbi:N-formylglutamate amidohydrolase [Oceanibium sediminis]|uniref:N-formylglutamate amidohydrolase n=1 Tax=Oceanibium sediminis TaxID=2026339 RepID=UPI000DD488AD|nr:N-formylglutamate amidohydrolase [Oceanibium sediminis]